MSREMIARLAHSEAEVRIPKPKRESRPKRRKKTARQKLVLALDDVARSIVLKRDKLQCQDRKYRAHVCRGEMQWAHLISRAFHWLRWMPANAVTLCAGAHFFYGQTPRGKELWPEWCERHLGSELWAALKRIRDSAPRPLRIADLEDMLFALYLEPLDREGF